MLDLMNFIKNGAFTDIVHIGLSTSELNKRLGRPSKIVGDLNSGYLYYDELRIGYLGDRIDELSVIFQETDKEFTIKVELLGESISSINRGTRIHEIVKLLNVSNIEWESYRESDLDYFYIKTYSNVFIVFDLDNGSLNRISCTDIR